MASYYILFGPQFIEWPLALMREISNRDPGASFAGLVTGGESCVEIIRERAGARLSRMEGLHDLEETWLKGDALGDLPRYQQMLGHGIKRILISDRQVGAGFVSGGLTPRSPLKDLATAPLSDVPRRYLAGLLRYVEEVLTQDAPDVIFCYAVAGSPATALAQMSRIAQVPFLSLSPARVGSRYVVDDTPDSMLGPVARCFAARSASSTGVPAAREDAQRYLEDFRSRPASPEYQRSVEARWKSTSGRTAWRRALRSSVAWAARRYRPSLRTSPPQEIAHRLKASLLGALASESGAFSPPPSSEEAFVYYPLHVDPEASTMVLAPYLTDQLAAIETVAKALPFTMDLVVKEHLPMLGHRPPNFYRRLTAMPNVRLVSPFVDRFKLLSGSRAVATIAGTVGLEALMVGKPVLLLGRAPYEVIEDGIVAESDPNGLPAAVDRLLTLESATDDRILRFLTCLFHHSFDVPSEALFGAVDEMVVREHRSVVERVAAEIVARVQG